MKYDPTTLLPQTFKQPKQHEVYTLLLDLRSQLEDRMPQAKFVVDQRISADYPLTTTRFYSVIGKKASRTFTFFTIETPTVQKDAYPVTIYTDNMVTQEVGDAGSLVEIITAIMDSESVAAKVAQLQ